jgi:hypothetical protein
VLLIISSEFELRKQIYASVVKWGEGRMRFTRIHESRRHFKQLGFGCADAHTNSLPPLPPYHPPTEPTLALWRAKAPPGGPPAPSCFSSCPSPCHSSSASPTTPQLTCPPHRSLLQQCLRSCRSVSAVSSAAVAAAARTMRYSLCHSLSSHSTFPWFTQMPSPPLLHPPPSLPQTSSTLPLSPLLPRTTASSSPSTT